MRYASLASVMMELVLLVLGTEMAARATVAVVASAARVTEICFTVVELLEAGG